jgi:hypothetical protein
MTEDDASGLPLSAQMTKEFKDSNARRQCHDPMRAGRTDERAVDEPSQRDD